MHSWQNWADLSHSSLLSLSFSRFLPLSLSLSLFLSLSLSLHHVHVQISAHSYLPLSNQQSKTSGTLLNTPLPRIEGIVISSTLHNNLFKYLIHVHKYKFQCQIQWFKKQGRKASYPQCRAEGEAFHYVIHKGLRSEIGELKVYCTNLGEGCEWIGELGELESHLESDNGCGYVIVPCPNKCILRKAYSGGRGKRSRNPKLICTMKRNDLDEHLTTL